MRNLEDAVAAVVRAAVTGLRNAVRDRLTGRPPTKQSLDAVESGPGVWEVPVDDTGPATDATGPADDGPTS
jgi:hypothetical protein